MLKEALDYANFTQIPFGKKVHANCLKNKLAVQLFIHQFLQEILRLNKKQNGRKQ
jgi:hypothetical protein